MFDPRQTSATDIEWTDRQREVLDLLAKSRSNSEIAQALGISLDGAKWHVSEILAKLGANSRDEAADYWRIRNGLRPRLMRGFRAATSLSGLRWIGGVAALAAVIVIGVLAVTALSGGDPPPGSPSVVPSATTPPSPTPAGPTPTAPAPGFTAIELQPGAPAEIEDGLIIYYTVTCYRCDAGGESFRAYRGPGGAVLEPSDRWRSNPFAPGSVYSSTSNLNGDIRYVAVCLEGDCGPLNEASTDARNVVFRSEDGGGTWHETGSLPSDAFFAFVLNSGEALVYSGSRRYWAWPSEAAMMPPLTGEYIFPIYQTVNGNLLWQRLENGSYDYAVDGGQPFTITAGGSQVESLVVFDWHADSIWASFVIGSGRATMVYVGAFGFSTQEEVTLRRAWKWEGEAFWPRAMLSGNRLLANVFYDEEPCLEWGCPVGEPPRPGALAPAVVDLEAATVHPLFELERDGNGIPLTGNQHAIIEKAVYGWKLARVVTPETCMEARAEPDLSSAASTCYVDGTLLWQTGAPVDVGGASWVPIDVVPTPGSRSPGWAPASSLELQ